MHRVNIRPISVNRAYRGRKFATPELKQYKSDLAYLLPRIVAPKGKLALTYRFGLSSKNSDADNCVKAFQDCLSEKYFFNDKLIYRIEIEKVDVKKGEEYVEFKIEEYLK